MSFRRRHLLGIDPLDADEIVAILDQALRFAEGEPPKRIAARVIALWFAEPSTRTRFSFDVAARRLGATTVAFHSSGSSLRKGESLVDTARTLEAAGADTIVLRHAEAGAPDLVAAHVRGSVVNAGDGTHEHPTQALVDALTLRRHFGRVKGLDVAIVGDIAHSRVARSGMLALTRLGARVTLCGPPTLVPEAMRSLGVEIEHDLDALVPRVDAMMALRMQQERQDGGFVPSRGEFASRWGLTAERAGRMKERAVVLHPGPFHRGVEIAGSVADGPRSLILEQVRLGVFTRMSVLALLGSSGA